MRSFSQAAIDTPRLRLRPLEPADAEQLLRLYSDPEFMRYWRSEAWRPSDRATALIEADQKELAAGEHLRLGIIEKDTDDLIGTYSLFNFNEQSRRAETGYGVAPLHRAKQMGSDRVPCTPSQDVVSSRGTWGQQRGESET